MDGRRPTYDELLAENAALKERVAVLEAQVARLTAQVESLLKRQAELLQRLEEKERSGKWRRVGSAHQFGGIEASGQDRFHIAVGTAHPTG